MPKPKRRRGRAEQPNRAHHAPSKTTRASIGLPTEIIVEILSYLNFRDILTCERVSKQLRAIIRETARIQYAVELAVANCVDGPANDKIDTRERLKMLTARQDAWKEVLFDTEEGSVIMPCSHHLLRRWDIRGGVLVCSHIEPGHELEEGPNPYYNILDVTRIRPDSELTGKWTKKLEREWTGLMAAPSQDLLVLWNNADVDCFRLMFLQLSTGCPHPRAKTETHTVPLVNDRTFSTLQIYGDLLVARNPRSIVLYDWATGATKILPGWKTGGILLSETCFVTAERTITAKEPGTLDVYLVQRVGSTLDLTLTAKFEMPKLLDGCTASLRVHDPYATGPHKGPSSSSEDNPAPFAVSPDVKIIALGLQVYIAEVTAGWLIYASTQPFLDAVTNWNSYSARLRRGVKRVPWVSWGPTSTWWFDGFMNWMNAPPIVGTRIMHHHTLLDLNVLDVKRDICQMSLQLERQEGSRPYDLSEQPLKLNPIYLKDGTVPSTYSCRFFAQPVSTYLPYRGISFPELKDRLVKRIRITEDGLLHVSSCPCGNHIFGFGLIFIKPAPDG